MSHKNLDRHNRWRNITVSFRVSPEENESINMRVRLSGLSKQDYITRRCEERDVIVQGNPRVYKALKKELSAVLAELERMQSSTEIDEMLHETIRMIAVTMKGMKSEFAERGGAYEA